MENAVKITKSVYLETNKYVP